MGAYRLAFSQPRALVGPQELMIGETALWVLPNPSGLNANYQQRELTRLFSELNAFASEL
jgi:TDG/mug DNA glycosylase family protein